MRIVIDEKLVIDEGIATLLIESWMAFGRVIREGILEGGKFSSR